ncbi:MAG TPA: patatin-like phospholipase family protein [Mycobacteriales bacterium]|nr:patatin-like phospholipase family protein [Mycobacteriales bacterium]
MTVPTFLRRGRRGAVAATESLPPREVVVLSGGGRLGAAQVGALRALLEAGIVPDAVVGSSVGAINAAYLAMAPTVERIDSLERIWCGLSRADIFPDRWLTVARRLASRSSHLYSPHRLRELLAAAIPQRDLADAAIPCHVVTTDLHTGQAVWWRSGDPVEVLSASACLPGLFPPVQINDRMYVDGGVSCPVPTQRALELGARRIWVLNLSRNVSGFPRAEQQMNALDVLLESFAISRAHLAHREPAHGPEQQVVRLPALPIDRRDLRDFSQTSRLLEAGHEAGRAMIAEEDRRTIPQQRLAG